MDYRIKAIDYLRGLAVVLILVVHVIASQDKLIWTEYTKIPLLFGLRDILHFTVIAIVICSGFSLYSRYNKIKLNRKDLTGFYKKRLKRILIPWWTFLTIFFLIAGFLKYVFNVELINLSRKYILSSFFMIGGIGYGWIIFLLLILSILFPFLNYLYKNVDKLHLFGTILFFYIIFIAYYYTQSINAFNIKISMGNVLATAGVATISGLILFGIGYLLKKQVYDKQLIEKKKLKLILISATVFILLLIGYHFSILDEHLSSTLNFNFGTMFAVFSSMVAGWSIIYMLGFMLKDFYQKHSVKRKELEMLLSCTLISIIIAGIYHLLKLDNQLYLNKYPPTPYYLSFSLMITLITLAIFFNYESLIPIKIKKTLKFYSINSYWFFMESALSITIISYFLSLISFSNIYVKFVIDISLNMLLLTGILILQNKLIIRIKSNFKKYTHLRILQS